MDEEVVLLEEQLATLQADVESLQNRLADAEARAAGREADVTRLRAQLAERDTAIAGHSAEAESLRSALTSAEERSRGAAARYRDVLLAREPDLPADLVSGDTVEEVDAAAVRARETVALVRQRLEAEAQLGRVPAGAPARGAPDASGLSAAEKIRFGLQHGS